MCTQTTRIQYLDNSCVLKAIWTEHQANSCTQNNLNYQANWCTQNNLNPIPGQLMYSKQCESSTRLIWIQAEPDIKFILIDEPLLIYTRGRRVHTWNTWTRWPKLAYFSPDPGQHRGIQTHIHFYTTYNLLFPPIHISCRSNGCI